MLDEHNSYLKSRHICSNIVCSIMIFLDSAFNILRCIGIFSWRAPSKWTRRAFNCYRAIIFIAASIITILMSIQICVARDLTILARTIDIWTMFSTGLYKWFCMTVFSREFSKLSTDLVGIQAQGSAAYGPSANLFTDDYLKLTKKITYWYMFSGQLASFFIMVSPLLTYPKGYVPI